MAGVDVLAVMDSAAELIGATFGYEDVDAVGMRQSLDAVAALITAAASVSSPGLTDVDLFNRLPTLRAALRNVQGGA